MSDDRFSSGTVQCALRFLILKLVVFGFAFLASGLRLPRLPYPPRAREARASSPSAFYWLAFAAVSEIGDKLRIRYEFLLIFLGFRILLRFFFS